MKVGKRKQKHTLNFRGAQSLEVELTLLGVFYFLELHQVLTHLQWIVKVKVAQSCPILCDAVDYTVLGILQARILEWVAVPFSRGSSQPRDRNPGLPHCRQILYQLSHQRSPKLEPLLLSQNPTSYLRITAANHLYSPLLYQLSY